MRTNSRLIQKYRSYSEDFKRSLVVDFESGKFTVAQLGRLHKIQVQLFITGSTSTQQQMKEV